MPAAFPPIHAVLALAVVAVWGSNFVVIRFGLDELPPLTFAALRFTLAALPLVFVLPRPPVPWHHLAGYGLFIGAGQFGLLFIAMDGHISPGLASLVVQVQVFFTIGASMSLRGERVRVYQIVALLVATAGIAVIGANVDATTTPLGLLLVIAAAANWSTGNMIAKASGPVSMVPYVAWSSLFAAPALFALALVAEGPTAVVDGIVGASATAWAAVAWQTVGNSLFGYAAWGFLLARHPAATITPVALLIPVFGIGTSALVLGEPLPAWKVAAAGLVIAGLAIGVLWPKLKRSTATPAPRA